MSDEYEQLRHWIGDVGAEMVMLKDREIDELKRKLAESEERERELRELLTKRWVRRPGAIRRWILERIVG